MLVPLDGWINYATLLPGVTSVAVDVLKAISNDT
jgi:hypothetical protein